MVGPNRIRADQAWFWTEDWQAKEAEADAALRTGKTTVYADAAAFLVSLDD